MGRKLKSRTKLIVTSIDIMDMTKDELINFINKNVAPVKKKIEYITNRGYFKASPEFREAVKILNNFTNKYALNSLTASRKFLSTQVGTINELRSLTRSLSAIKELKTREISREYFRLKKEYADKGIDFDDAFNLLSKLSSEFHEIYAILSYSGEAGTSEMVKQGATTKEILTKFFDTLADKVPTEAQQKKIDRVIEKVKRKYSATEFDDITWYYYSGNNSYIDWNDEDDF